MGVLEILVHSLWIYCISSQEINPLFFSTPMMFICQKIPYSHSMAHFDFLLSVYSYNKQMSMETEILILRMNPCLSNKLLSWKPSKAGKS